jgi:hypothetical protein
MATIKKACKGTSYPKSSNVSKRLGSPSKAKSGTSLGMKSVKAGFDKNPGVTRADIIVAGKGKAKKGIKIKKAQTGITDKTGYRIPKMTEDDIVSGKTNYRVKEWEKERIQKLQNRRAQVPATKGRSGPGIYGGRKSIFGKAFMDNESDGMLQGVKGWRLGADKEKAWEEDVKRKPSYKKGGSVKKSAPKKMIMKKGGKMTKRCAYGCK